MFKKLIPIAAALSLTGCGITSLFEDEDNAQPPAELVQFEPSVELQEIWQASVGSGTDEYDVEIHLAVSDSQIFAADRHGLVKALDSQTGSTRWQKELELSLAGGVGVGEGKVLLGSDEGEVVVLDEQSGDVLWQKKLTSEILSVPQIGRGVVVVRTIDGKLYGLNAESGQQLWIYDRGVPVLTLRGNSSPLIAGELVFTGFDSGKVAVVGLDHGRLLWESAIAVPRGRSEIERLVDIDGDLKLLGRALFVATYHGRVAALDALNGNVFWSRDMSSYAGLGLGENQLFVSDEESFVWALDARSGQSLWKQDQLARRDLTAPVAVGNNVYVADGMGFLHILSATDGSFIGREEVDGEGINTAPLVVGNRLYVFANSGDIVAYQLP